MQAQRTDVSFIDPSGNLLFHFALDIVPAVGLGLQHHGSRFEVAPSDADREGAG